MYPSPFPDPLASARVRSIAWGLSLLAALACVQARAATKYPTPSGQAQSTAILAETEGTAVTSSLLESKLKEVEAATDLDEAAKGKLTEQYRKALSNLESKKSHEAKAAAFAKALEEAPAETARLREDIASAPDQPRLEPVAPATTLQAVEQLLCRLALSLPQDVSATVYEEQVDGLK